MNFLYLFTGRDTAIQVGPFVFSFFFSVKNYLCLHFKSHYLCIDFKAYLLAYSSNSPHFKSYDLFYQSNLLPLSTKSYYLCLHFKPYYLRIPLPLLTLQILQFMPKLQIRLPSPTLKSLLPLATLQILLPSPTLQNSYCICLHFKSY